MEWQLSPRQGYAMHNLLTLYQSPGQVVDVLGMVGTDRGQQVSSGQEQKLVSTDTPCCVKGDLGVFRSQGKGLDCCNSLKLVIVDIM